MNRKKIFLNIIALVCLPTISYANSELAQCNDPAVALLSVADFNGDGQVTRKDIHMLRDAVHEREYYALFDRNADGVLNHKDIHMAKYEMHLNSTPTDRQLAKMYLRFKHFQTLSGFEALQSMGYQDYGGVLAFHGQHWLNTAGGLAVLGVRKADPFIAEGVNVLGDGSSVPALFWGEGAVPLFNDPSASNGLSTLDWPIPDGIWNTERVQAFAGGPADFFPDTDTDLWHPHAGLCLTKQDLGNGSEWVLDQYTSNAECQATPNLQKTEINGQLVNIWGNFWMLHAWLYKLNPRGVFGNVHPCIDINGASEEKLSAGREIPPFFKAVMDNHGAAPQK